jgi:hypothetical protein
MNYNNSTEVSYLQTVAKIGIRQHSRPRDIFDLSSWLVLWKPVGKVMLMILPLVLVVNMCLASVVTSIERSIVDVDNQRHELMDKNMGLLARKASLWSPVNMQQLAGEKLALHAGSGDQVGRFDNRTGSFIYP